MTDDNTFSLERSKWMIENHVCSEIQYGEIHSDLCTYDMSDPEWHELLHSALDEWLRKSNGSGCFYVGNISEMMGDE